MKNFNEILANFLENQSRVDLRKILQENYGELNELDFKEIWIKTPKLAKHILALGNSGGGILIIGVLQKQNGEIDPVGLSKFKDKADLDNQLSNFLPNKLKYEVSDFSYKESEYGKLKGKMFQTIIVYSDSRYIPFISSKNSEEIKKNTIYIRQGTKTIEADYEKLQEIINKRIETEYSSTNEFQLEEHINQLKYLFSLIPRTFTLPHWYYDAEEDLKEQEMFIKKNPNYPDDEFEDFVNKLIDIKKEIIEKEIRK